jgi:hypothetical protein
VAVALRQKSNQKMNLKDLVFTSKGRVPRIIRNTSRRSDVVGLALVWIRINVKASLEPAAEVKAKRAASLRVEANHVYGELSGEI